MGGKGRGGRGVWLGTDDQLVSLRADASTRQFLGLLVSFKADYKALNPQPQTPGFSVLLVQGLGLRAWEESGSSELVKESLEVGFGVYRGYRGI